MTMQHAELEPVAVLADRLQADGDPRGELLALELAATLSDSIEESRRLCLAAHTLRVADPDLAWPPALESVRGLVRAGLLVAGAWSPEHAPGLLASLGPSCRELVVAHDRNDIGLRALHDAQARVQLRLDGLWERRVSTGNQLLELRLAPEQTIDLRALGLIGMVSNPGVLRQLHALAQLDIGGARLDPDLLKQLPALGLRSLSVGLAEPDQLPRILDACPLLEQLTLGDFERSLEPLAGLERLRSLALIDHRAGKWSAAKLPRGLSLPRLESLFVSAPTRDDIEHIAALGLRRLTVFEPIGALNEIVVALAKLDTLEHLSVFCRHLRFIDLEPLSGLARVRSLEFAGVHGALQAPATLERAAFRGPGRVQIRGVVPTLHCGPDPIYRVWTQVDLDEVKTLSLAAAWRGVEQLDSASETLAAIEILELDDSMVHSKWITWLGQLPRLRTLILPNLTNSEQRTAAELVPHLQIVGADAARLRPVWPSAVEIDLLAPSNWPKCE